MYLVSKLSSVCPTVSCVADMATRLCLLLALCIVLSGCEAAGQFRPMKPVKMELILSNPAGNSIVTAVRLTRDNLEPRYVLLYRDGQIDEEQQHPQYLGRTKLQSLISTDGEINLTLDNVTEKDSGVYECRVRTEIKSNTRRKRAALESTIIHLRVDPGESLSLDQNQQLLVLDLRSDDDDLQWDQTNSWFCSAGRGHIGLVAGLVVVLVVVLAVSIWKKMKTPSPPPLRRDEAVEPLQV
uniref:Butyrophilin-like protein 8 n=1 Tax=Poecilia latipinna TaxID=48699 RepID=A0A3B3V0J6_9TELE